MPLKAKFDDWFGQEPAKKLAEAGYSGMNLRDAKWQVLNAFRKNGIVGAGKELERLIQEIDSIKKSQACLQAFYERRRD